MVNIDNSIEEKSLLQDREFVADLISNKPGSWERFIDFSAKIIAYHKQHLHDFGFTTHDLVNTVFDYLTDNHHRQLRNFLDNDWPLLVFISNAFKAAKSRLLYRYQRNREKEVSDSDPGIALIDQSYSYGYSQGTLQDYREVLKLAFSILWERNSRRAYIYFLRRKLELPSKETADLLGMTITNVDVVLKRAESDLKDILEEMGINSDILHDN